MHFLKLTSSLLALSTALFAGSAAAQSYPNPTFPGLPLPNTLPRTYLDRAKQTVDIHDFCATLDGSFDDTACTQTAVNALCADANGGGVLNLGRVKMALNASTGVQITCSGITIKGAGGFSNAFATNHATTINVIGSGAVPIFNFVASDFQANYVYGGSVLDVGFHFNNFNSGTSITQTGAAIAFNHCIGCLAEGVYSYAAYKTVANYSGYMNRVTQFFFEGGIPGGVAIETYGNYVQQNGSSCVSDACFGRSDIFEVDHGSTYASTQTINGTLNQVALWVHDFAATTWVDSVAFNQPGIGLKITCAGMPGINECPGFVTTKDLEVEANGNSVAGAAYNIDASDFVHLNLINPQLFGNNVGSNIRMYAQNYSGASQADITNPYMNNATADCMVVAINSVRISGGSIFGCNTANAGSNGITVRPETPGGATIDPKYSGSISITGVHFCYFNGPSAAMGGIFFSGTGADSYAMIANNTFRGCTAATAGVADGVHNAVVANNTGT